MSGHTRSTPGSGSGCSSLASGSYSTLSCAGGGRIVVSGYTRSDGTQVSGYTRAAPSTSVVQCIHQRYISCELM